MLEGTLYAEQALNCLLKADNRDAERSFVNKDAVHLDTYWQLSPAFSDRVSRYAARVMPETERSAAP